MTNSKQTKKALLSSVIALVLCLSMLIGTTFAWFTDSVESGLNEIKAGNLDVELDYYSATEKDWLTVENATDLFSDELWEPGHTEVVYLRLTNAGTLDLKWQLGINIAAEQGSISVVEGNPAFKLSDFIQFGVVEGVNGETSAYAEREDAIDDLDEAKIKKLNAGYSDSGAMTAGAVEYVAVVVYMPETVGNEANYMKGAPVPSIDLGVKLYATQKDAESDSFGDDYDKNASLTVTEDSHKDGTLTLAQAIAQVEDGGIVFVEPGTYTIGSVITITGKSLSIIGMGNVQLEYAQTGGSHFFNVTSDSNVSFENMTLVNAAKHGIYVRNDSVVTLTDVSVSGSRGSADIMVDEASDAAHGKNTASYVWMYNSSAERVALCASPVTTVAATQDTYVYFNYDAESTVGSIEKQSINKKPENIYINGVNVEGNGMNLYVTNDAELKAALETIQNNSKYHNVPVYVHLAAGEYSADHVINQYPEWNGTVGAGGSGNNYASGVPAGEPGTVITFVGETAATYNLRAAAAPTVVFTGNVTVNGFGNAGTGFGTATATTTFQNIVFDGANSVEANNEDYIVMYVKAGANNVTFDGCVFKNATHVTLGNRASDAAGTVNVTGCTFDNGGCLAGYVETLNVSDTKVAAAKNGFIDKKRAGKVTVDNCDVVCDVYFLRTDNSGIAVEVTNTTVKQTDVPNSKGTGLVVFRGSGHTVRFVDCELTYQTLKGGAGTGELSITNFEDKDGITYAKDGVTGESTLYLVPADYEGTTVTVPEGVTAIGNYAFKDNTNVETVILGKDVTDLGRGFDSNTSIKKVVLNEGLTTISSRAFKGTTALEEVVISSTVTEIADNAFQKSGIKEIVIPENVKTIGETAFGASLIEEVTFEGDIAIQGYAFRGCTKLRKVYLNGYDVTFVPSTLNGRNSTWFCNGESNNPNTSDIDFYVKNEVIKERVLTAMGAERNNTDVECTDASNGNGTYTDSESNTYAYAADSSSVSTAISNGAKTVFLADGNYIIPDSAQGKELTFVGNGKTVVATQDDGSYEGCDYSLDGATVTFKNITITTDSHTYTGYARLNATYENCTINGTYTLYGNSTFVDCTFNVSGDVYNIWTWGAPSATFDGCAFNTSGKAILLYGGTDTVLTVKNCVFNDTNDYDNVNNKAAIEVGSDWATDTKTVIASNCAVNGFDVTNKGTSTGSTLWGNKNSLPTNRLSVTIDGVRVY